MNTAYNIYFDIAAVLIYSTLFLYTKKTVKGHRLQNIIFMLMTINGLLSGIADILSAYGNTVDANMFFKTTRAYYNYMYLGIHNIQPVLFLLYVLASSNLLTVYIWKKVARLSFIPYTIIPVLLLINTQNGIIFYFDDTTDSNLTYFHGPLILTLYVIAMSYIIALLTIALKSNKYMSSRDKNATKLIAIGAVVSVALQLMMPDILIELFIQALLLLSLFLSIEHTSMQFNEHTNCYSRNMFIDMLNTVIASKRDVTLLSLNIKGMSYFRLFKTKKDADEAMRAITAFIQKCTSIETIYNFSGNNLCAILPTYSESEKEIFFEKAAQAYNLWEYKDKIKLRVASFSIPRDADNLEDALALLESMNYKSNDFTVPEEQVLKSKRNIQIAHALQNGLKKGYFHVVLQPIIKNEKVVSSEVLIRFEDPEIGVLQPSEFIPIAERTGLIWDIGLFTLREAAKVLSSKDCKRSTIQYLEVNLSVAQCLHGGCTEAFMNILNEYEIKPEQINLEITESAFIDDFDVFYQECQELKAAGFRFSIDDYGSGFSNYRYIVAVNPDIVKLDRDILLEAEEQESGKTFYQSTVATIKKLGYHIVSEGVETDKQKSFVQEAGADYIQGYLYARPLELSDYYRYLNANGTQKGVL